MPKPFLELLAGVVMVSVLVVESLMTGLAQRYTVCYVVSLIREIRIGVQMMSNEIATLIGPTDLTSVTISLVHGFTPYDVFVCVSVVDSLFIGQLRVVGVVPYTPRSYTTRTYTTLTIQVLTQTNGSFVATGGYVPHGLVDSSAGSTLYYLAINVLHFAPILAEHLDDVGVVVVQRGGTTMLSQTRIVTGRITNRIIHTWV